MIKKNPSYRVTVYFKNGISNEWQQQVIQYPLTCRFNSTRGTFSQSNKCTIELYNLNQTTRMAIFKDALVGDLDNNNWKLIKLEAGWNGVLSQIFYGRILQAYSTKNGGITDVITRIECQPFDIFDSYSSYTFAAGTGYREAYKTMASDLGNCQFGHLGRLEGSFKTQTTFEGKTLECLNQLTGGNTYVDNGVLNTLMSNEVIEVPVPLITDANGLLETPIRRDATLTIKTLFEPSLVVGQLLEIRSRIQSQYDGQYKVLGFTHDCLISPTQSGQRTTTIDLWIIPTLTGSDINLTNEEVTSGAVKVKGEKVSEIVPKNISNTWIMPARGRLSSPYGWRSDPFDGTRTFHKGIDIANNAGTPIKAPAAGTVYYRGWENNLNGNTIRIDHGYINGTKVESVYIHLQGFNVQSGAKVKQGDVIGFMGSTGNSTGPHLHMSVYEGKRGNHVNPFKYIDKSKY